MRKRLETTTTDSEVHVNTEVNTVVDSGNEPTPNVSNIKVEIENKTISPNTVNLKLPDSTRKKIKKRNDKSDKRGTQKHQQILGEDQCREKK